MDFDVFISHASEDKDAVARPLAAHLQGLGLRVWFDELELTLGDSLRRNIDLGLARSRYGIVVLSPAFFQKEWPNKELDGLFAREDGRAKVLLPIWHNVSIDDILRYSPMLADKVAVSTSRGLAHVATQVVDAVRRSVLEGENAPIRVVDSEPIFLARVRRQMLVSENAWELRQALYELEAHLSKYPHAPEARLLRDKLHKAITQAERQEQVRPCAPPPDTADAPAASHPPKMQQSPAAWVRSLLFWLAALIVVAYFVLNAYGAV